MPPVMSFNLIPIAQLLFSTAQFQKNLFPWMPQPRTAKILAKPIKECYIFVENLHPGAMDKLGFSWEVVHKLNQNAYTAAR